MLFVNWWRWWESNPRPKTVPRTDIYSLFHHEFSVGSDEQTSTEAFDEFFEVDHSNISLPLFFISYTQSKSKD